MSRRLLLSLGLAATAVAAVLVQVVWTVLFLGVSSDPVAYAMGLLSGIVVPLAMTSAGAVLLPRRLGWLRWSMLLAVALASLAVALGTAAGFLADLPDPRPSSVALDASMSVLVLAIAFFVTIVYVALTGAPALPVILRVFLAVVLGVVGTIVLAAFIASVVGLWAAAVAQLVLTIALRKRIGAPASLERAA